MDNIVLYTVCLGFGGAGAWMVARWGKRLSLIDKANDRSSHDGVVPKGGGIGILAAFLVSALFLKFPALFWAPATLVALFSLYGDRVELSPKIRPPVQFLAAFVILLVVFPVFSPIVSSLRSPISDLCPLSSVFFFSLFSSWVQPTITTSWMGSTGLRGLRGCGV